MARLSDEQITKEITDKGFKVVDISNYQNVKTPLKIKCKHEHEIEADLFSIRKKTFRCPNCHGGEIEILENPPQKKGYRVIALDNATQNMGVSIFDDGELVYFTLLKFNGTDFDKRMVRIRDVVVDVIIEEWQPDHLVFEDIQYQNNYNTYKKLAMLLGMLTVEANSREIPNALVPPVTWRSHFQISGNRTAVKNKAINLIAEMYNKIVIDDIAEAILLGRYFCDKHLYQHIRKRAF